MAVEIYVGDRPLSDLTPAERKALGQRIAELTKGGALIAAERTLAKAEADKPEKPA